jgi:phospholipid/cholesterol/gamma-HCH transport system substrate-binding protein
MRRRKPHRRKSRLSRFQSGALGILFIVLLSYGCYTKFANPVASQFQIRATFPSANGLVPNAPVRIAGVNVGKVVGVQALGGDSNSGGGQQGAVVTMDIDQEGLPIHADATFAIRPRIFLEGNFFVDLHPGSPSAPAVGNNHPFPIQSGTDPIQLDEVLTSLQLNTRQNLQTLIQQYGKAVYLSGPSYDAGIKYFLPSFKYTSEVTHDFLGTQPHDLSTFINQGGTVSGALDAHPENLENLITYFNTTANSFARENTNLEAAVHELPTTLAVAIPAFNALNAAFPPLREFARALLPGVRSSGPAIDASLPFIEQLRLLVQPAELRGLTADLAVTVPALAKLTKGTIPLMKNDVRPVASCVANIIYPWSQLTLNDGVFSGTTGFPLRKVFQEAVDYLPGLAGESRNFDANGPFIRVLLTGGSLTYSLQPGLFGSALSSITSVQPQVPANYARPPLHPNTPCETQAPITSLTATPGPPIQSLKTNLNAPGAALRWTSAVLGAIADIKQVSSQEGIKVDVPTSLTKELKLP